MPKLIDVIGKKFGLLTVVRRADGPGRPKYHCACECGGEKTVRNKEKKNASGGI